MDYVFWFGMGFLTAWAIVLGRAEKALHLDDWSEILED